MTSHPLFSGLIPSLVFSLILAMAAPALAQDAAPSEAQLQQAPGTQTQPETAPQTPAPEQPIAQAAPGAVDPCPVPRGAATSSPDDMAKVQEEIDRFTLCVQRAQLLERLNESAVKNQEAADVTLGLAQPSANGMPAGPGMIPGMAGPQRGLAPLPANALAGADISPQANSAAGTGIPSAAEEETTREPAKKEEEKSKDWTIREIFGNGANVQARLVSPDGDEVKASNGMRLPDGKTTVVRITPAGVTIRDGGITKPLEWARG